MDRWKGIALETCKQARNPFLPTIFPPLPLGEVLAKLEPGTLLLLASLEAGAMPWVEARRRFSGAESRTWEKICVAVGPEGDFSPGEYGLLGERNCLPISLGPRILRSEIAALSLLVALQLELEGGDGLAML
jgi:16S rRNA (uracil1498-N3)-methyltransferase